MEHFFQNIPGFFTFRHIYGYMVKLYPDGSHFVEVGSWFGSSTVFMAVEIINSGKNIMLDAVDTWESNWTPEISLPSFIEAKEYSAFDEFLKNIESVKHIVTPIRMESVKATTFYRDKSLEFVFIDSSHTYEDVSNDLKAWFPKVKHGGHIAGHDFPWPNVKKATEEFFEDKGRFHTDPNQGIWSYFIS